MTVISLFLQFPSPRMETIGLFVCIDALVSDWTRIGSYNESTCVLLEVAS